MPLTSSGLEVALCSLGRPEGKHTEAKMEFLESAFLIGGGATALTDLWSGVRRRLLGIVPPDFGLVGRWLAHMARGRFRHDSIAAAPAVRGERLVGWLAHYAIGMSFAALLLFHLGNGLDVRADPRPLRWPSASAPSGPHSS